MSTPYGPVPPLAPVKRIPAQDSSIQDNTSALQALTTVMGSPAQQAQLLALLEQIVTSGAQPFVPNIESGSILEQPPGIWTMATPPLAYRVWGGYVTGVVTSSTGYSGNDQVYGKVYTKATNPQANMANAPPGPALIVAHIELGLGGPSQADSETVSMQLPGVSIPAGTPLILDVNGNHPVTAAEIRMSGNIFYSIPLWLHVYRLSMAT